MNAELGTMAGVVRRLRTERRWTLDHAAVRLGISRRLLAQIEAGEGNPSLSTMLAIAQGFGVHLTDLLDAEPAPAGVTVNDDPATAPVLWSTPNGSSARLLVGRDALELWSWTMAPGDRRASPAHAADSLEALHVLDGTVHLEVGDRTVTVGTGGSIAFDAGTPHAYRNDDTRPVSFVLVVHDPAH